MLRSCDAGSNQSALAPHLFEYVTEFACSTFRSPPAGLGPSIAFERLQRTNRRARQQQPRPGTMRPPKHSESAQKAGFSCLSACFNPPRVAGAGDGVVPSDDDDLDRLRALMQRHGEHIMSYSTLQQGMRHFEMQGAQGDRCAARRGMSHLIQRGAATAGWGRYARPSLTPPLPTSPLTG